MAITRYQVFLASSFQEFRELRRALSERLSRLSKPPIEAIDLDDNSPDPKPPLSRCYYAIDNSELLVLLVGETYGGTPHNRESYTQLEYRYALSSRKPILPFIIRNGANGRVAQSRDPKVEKWIDEIQKNHTLSNLDASLDKEQLSLTIFEQIRERLLELYSDGDISILDETDQQSEPWEESIIKRDQLASAPLRSASEANSNSMLKSFANDHAKEALKALELKLPQIAIHHLQQAVNMVPLDVVLGYWLSRLLVATGRQRHCVEGRRIALRCAEVAKTLEDYELKAMACSIIAARASERINEPEVAKEYARRAHDIMPHHWLAKFEYGRQCALTGDAQEALRLAGQAFWLQPYSIYRVQADFAFRSLGKAFEDFRTRLREVVTEETARVAKTENLIEEFSNGFGISSGVVMSAPADDAPSRKPPIIELVRNANRSANASLHLLQFSAMKLNSEYDAFIFNSEKGLRPETRIQIQGGIHTEQHNVQTLSREHAEATRNHDDLDQRKVIVLIVGFLITFVMLLVLVLAITLSAGDLGVFAFFVGVITGLATYALYQSTKSNLEKARVTLESIGTRLQEAKDSLNKLQTAQQRFETSDSHLRKNLETFAHLVNQFEKIDLRRLPFSPAPPIDRKRSIDVVRVDPTKLTTLGLTADPELLPQPLRGLLLPLSPSAKYWLARRVTFEGSEILSRSGAYFHPVKSNNNPVNNDGQETRPYTVDYVDADEVNEDDFDDDEINEDDLDEDEVDEDEVVW